MKRRHWRASLFLIMALFLYITWCVQGSVQAAEPLSNEDFIRFHVVANSNSPEDQALKLAVRDKLLEFVEAGLSAEAQGRGVSLEVLDAAFSEQWILAHLKDIEAAALAALRNEGCNFPVQADIGVRWIPAKTYGNITFPAGNYKALTVIIGEGAGENWWCVLFPPLCLIDGEDPLGLDKKYEPLRTAEEPVTLELKFKTLEKIKKQS